MQGAGRGREAKADASTAEVETSTRCEHGRGDAGEPLTRHMGRETICGEDIDSWACLLQGDVTESRKR